MTAPYSTNWNTGATTGPKPGSIYFGYLHKNWFLGGCHFSPFSAGYFGQGNRFQMANVPLLKINPKVVKENKVGISGWELAWSHCPW